MYNSVLCIHACMLHAPSATGACAIGKYTTWPHNTRWSVHPTLVGYRYPKLWWCTLAASARAWYNLESHLCRSGIRGHIMHEAGRCSAESRSQLPQKWASEAILIRSASTLPCVRGSRAAYRTSTSRMPFVRKPRNRCESISPRALQLQKDWPANAARFQAAALGAAKTPCHRKRWRGPGE